MKLFDIFMSRKRLFLDQEQIVISAIHGQFSQVQINPDSTLRDDGKKKPLDYSGIHDIFLYLIFLH